MDIPGLWRSQARAEEENERERSLYVLTATLSCTACSVMRGVGVTFGGNNSGRTGLGVRSAKERREERLFLFVG